MSVLIAAVKLDYIPLVNGDEEVVPGDLMALRYGLEALTKADNSDYAREEQLWEKAYASLRELSNDNTGAGAEGSVGMHDEFSMEDIGEPTWCRTSRYGIYGV